MLSPLLRPLLRAAAGISEGGSSSSQCSMAYDTKRSDRCWRSTRSADAALDSRPEPGPSAARCEGAFSRRQQLSEASSCTQRMIGGRPSTACVEESEHQWETIRRRSDNAHLWHDELLEGRLRLVDGEEADGLRDGRVIDEELRGREEVQQVAVGAGEGGLDRRTPREQLLQLLLQLTVAVARGSSCRPRT